LASLYVFLHAAWSFRNVSVANDPINSQLFDKIVRRMSRPLIFGIVTVFVGVIWWFVLLSPNVLLVMERSVLLNILLTIFFGLCGLITLLIILGPILNPRSVNTGFAVCLFIFGLTALASAEFIREAVRKPWIVDQVVLGNQIYAGEVNERQETGFLRASYWQQLPAEKVRLGGMVFMYHCNNCHAAEHGLSAVGPLLYGESKEKIAETIKNLNQPVISMPPWSGTDEELDALAEFLLTVRPAN
jgi:hypothetical protein